MTSDLHQAFAKLIYRKAQIPADVDLREESATREWAESLTRPTIDFFLFAINENTDKRQTNLESSRGNGIACKRMRPRRIDLHYMVSVLTSDVHDEHELLWRVLATLMKYPEWPEDILPDALRSGDIGITTRIVDQDESTRFVEIWNSLGTPPHPALHYVVTAPLDLDIVLQAPLVLTRTARYSSSGNLQSAVQTAVQIGGTVRSKNGEPLAGVEVTIAGSAAEGSWTGDDGRFLVPGMRNGPTTLDVTGSGKVRKRVELNIPQESYDIVLDE